VRSYLRAATLKSNKSNVYTVEIKYLAFLVRQKIRNDYGSGHKIDFVLKRNRMFSSIKTIKESHD
jgi:hypothetical protein